MEKPKAETALDLLFRAIADGRIDRVELLIEEGVDINSSNKWRATPLHEAVVSGYTNIVALLLANGAEVNAQDHEGCTPIWHAAEQRLWGITERLIEAGADLNIEGQRCSPLYAYNRAVRGGDDFEELLTSNGAEEHDSFDECSGVHITDIVPPEAHEEIKGMLSSDTASKGQAGPGVDGSGSALAGI